MAGLAIRYDNQDSENHNSKEPKGNADDLKIIWKGKRIAKVVFPSGKEVVFEE